MKSESEWRETKDVIVQVHNTTLKKNKKNEVNVRTEIWLNKKKEKKARTYGTCME